MSTMKPSLPSFVDLLSSLGLNEAETQNRPSHLRNDSWGSQSSASSRISPMHSPQVRLSGRQPSNAGASRRFSPYGPPPDLNDRRGSLPTLSVLPPPHIQSRSSASSIAAQRRRSGSLPTLLESPFAHGLSMRDAQGHFPSEASISEVSSSATSPGSSAMAASASHEYTFPPPPHNDTRRAQNHTLVNADRTDTREHTALPPLSPLSPQKRHLAPRTRLSIAISSPSPPPEPSLRSPNVSVSSPFRASHNSSNHMDTNAPSGAGVAVAHQSRQSLVSPLISSFLRKSTSHASLSTPGGPASPVRAHYHPYAYSSSPIDSSAPQLPSAAPDDAGSGSGVRDGGGGEPEVPVGQRYKRRGSLTLSLAPLSLSVSRHGRQSTMQHRRTTSSSSTASAPRTPLSPMAIPTLPDAVGMVQRNMTMGMNLTMGMSMGHGNNNSGNLGGGTGGSSTPMNGSPSSGPTQAAAPIMMVPSLPSLSVPVPPLGGQASTSSISPSKHHPRDRGAGKMRSMGHMRTGSGDRAARWEASPSVSSNGLGQRRSPQRSSTLSNEKERKRVLRASASTSFPPTSAASPASSYNSSSRQPPFFPRKNVTAPPTITVKTEDEDIDELADDSLTATASTSVSNVSRSIDADHEHEHDPGYASARSAGSSSAGSFGYDAQDEMQLDDDDYASSFYDSATGLGGIPISARRRASLHPLDGTTPGPHHASHTRSYSDNGPIVAGGGSSTSTLTSKTRSHASGGGMYYSRPLPPSSYTSFTYPPPSTNTVSASLAGLRISRRSHSSSSTSSSNSNSNSAGRAERDKWAGNERNSKNSRNGFASHSSSSGTRTPTGIASSSSRGNSAGPSSSPMPAPAQRRSPPSVVVSSAA